VGLDLSLIERRLAMILEENEFLKSIKKQNYNEFLNDGKSRRSTARAIETIAQSIIDICSHIVAQKHFGISDTYKGTIELVTQHHIISMDLATNLQKVVAMRNVLVHQYLDIDFEIVWNAIDTLLVDAHTFVQEIKKHLTTESI